MHMYLLLQALIFSTQMVVRKLEPNKGSGIPSFTGLGAIRYLACKARNVGKLDHDFNYITVGMRIGR